MCRGNRATNRGVDADASGRRQIACFSRASLRHFEIDAMHAYSRRERQHSRARKGVISGRARRTRAASPPGPGHRRTRLAEPPDPLLELSRDIRSLRLLAAALPDVSRNPSSRKCSEAARSIVVHGPGNSANGGTSGERATTVNRPPHPSVVLHEVVERGDELLRASPQAFPFFGENDHHRAPVSGLAQRSCARPSRGRFDRSSRTRRLRLSPRVAVCGASGSGHRADQGAPSSRRRSSHARNTTLAGFPNTVAPEGTSRVTTLPAPTTAPSPTETFGRTHAWGYTMTSLPILAPPPTKTPLPI